MQSIYKFGWVAAFLITLLVGCDKSTEPATTTSANKADTLQATEVVAATNGQAAQEELTPSWATHIAEYPKNWVAADAPLIIRFTHAVVTPEQVNTAFNPSLISLDSKTPVNLVFTADNELRITPVERLPNDTALHLRLSPHGLQGIDESLKDFEFDIHTIKQAIDLQVTGLVNLDQQANLMQLNGVITTADSADLELVKKVLSITLNGVAQEVSWDQSPSRKSNSFILSNIARTTDKGNLHLEWDGTVLGVAEKGARDMDIPALDVFQVTGVQVVHEPQTAIEVRFSEALDSRQNLAGLISLSPVENATAANSRFQTSVTGSLLRITPAQVSGGDWELKLTPSLRSDARQTLKTEFEKTLVLQLVQPKVRFIGNSVILPPASQMSVPFEAAGIDSVQITAFKVFANNMGQYLQQQRLTDNYANNNTGRYLWRKVYRLPEVPRSGPERFNLDLTELMAQHPDGLVRLELRIDRSNSIYSCDQPRPTKTKLAAPQSYDGERDQGEELPEWYNQYYQAQGYYSYSERNNPCRDAYYSYGNNISSARNFLVSNIGMIAKRADKNQVQVITTELNSALPMKGTSITAYNYQQQAIGTGITDDYGMLQLNTDGQAYYLEARKDKQIGYMRLRDSEALPTNQFDVNGENIKGGLKGFIYGERDVWRPGDDIFLTFILEDKLQQLPPKHPVRLDLFDPSGKKVLSQTNVQPVNNFYHFALKTEETAPTGNYRAVVHVGNRFFDQILKVEMVVPNRIKVDLTPAATPLNLKTMPVQMDLFAQWLQGATAKNLKADSEVKLSARKTHFAGYDQFNFDDAVRSFSGSNQKVFDGKLDATGKASFPLKVSLSEPPPGMLTATFITRVFEESGNFSTIIRPFELQPFEQWVGLNIPKGKGYMSAISRDEDHPVLIQTLDEQGKPLPQRRVEVKVYEIGWRWWWDEGGDNLAEYVNDSTHTQVTSEELVSDEFGRINWTLAKQKYDWGRHIVRVCDLDAKDASNAHCASEVVYLGWSYKASARSDSATQLMLSSDKEKYQVGDVARVRLPSAREGRMLLSIESGSAVLQSRWLDMQPNQTEIEVPITAAMAPNVYVHLALLLPHQTRAADTPMRLYGIVPLLVEDPATRLTPQLDMPSEVRPETTFNIKVSEQQQRAMTYTLALVDEGLLGLTNFHVPDAHQAFYKREALGVNTWDLFDQVVGGYGASLERVLSLGGSDAALEAERKRRERRFPPVVQFLGPFNLAAGETRTHEITLPPYMGAVRVMVVAGAMEKQKDQSFAQEKLGSAYGNVEKTLTVTQPVTLFATLPRVLGPGESVNLPVNVFVSDASITQVDISLEANEIFTIEEGSATLDFSEPGDAIANLKLKVNDRIGKGRVKVTARSGSESATQEIFIDSRAANPPASVWETKLLQPGETWQFTLKANGMIGTNEATLEVSTLPPLNLEQRLEYLISYPHGCVEQTTSAVFPQLRLSKLVSLSEKQKAEVDKNIAAGIRRLADFQVGSGGFSYWPGDSYVNDWASNYAGHFLVEAKRAGYTVPTTMFDNWVKFQANAARDNQSYSHGYDESVTAYRLYTLALANKAELPAMNRLREHFATSAEPKYSYRNNARWLLAKAYQQLGINAAAVELLGNQHFAIPGYDEWGYTYGSELRDSAILLSTLTGMDVESERAWTLAEKIATDLSSDNWYSTQSIAWALIAISDFAEHNALGNDGAIKFALQEEGQTQWRDLSSNQTFYRRKLQSTQIILRNDSTTPIRALVSNRGIPANLHEKASSNGLQMQVNFLTMDNKPLNINSLPQGTDFVAEITVSGEFNHIQRLEDLALTAVVPSGWQIRNERLEGSQLPKGIDYMDIRDDRLLAYFSLWDDYYWYYRYQDRNQTSVTLRMILNASYSGKFYLPGWQASAMYNEKIQAKTKGNWIEVLDK